MWKNHVLNKFSYEVIGEEVENKARCGADNLCTNELNYLYTTCRPNTVPTCHMSGVCHFLQNKQKYKFCTTVGITTGVYVKVMTARQNVLEF